MTGGCSGPGEASGLAGSGGIKGVLGVLDILFLLYGYGWIAVAGGKTLELSDGEIRQDGGFIRIKKRLIQDDLYSQVRRP